MEKPERNTATPLYIVLKENGAIGKENGIYARKLLKLTGKKSSRDITKMAQDERKNTPVEEVGTRYICSDTVHGYYLPSCIDDLKHTHNALHKAAMTRLAVVQPVAEYFKCGCPTPFHSLMKWKPDKEARTKRNITEKPTPKRP